MNFFLNDNFATYNDKKESYSIEIENLTAFSYKQNIVEKEGYSIKYYSGIHLIKSPLVKDFELSFILTHFKPIITDRDIEWGIAFGLKDVKDLYYEMFLRQNSEKDTEIILYKVINYARKEISKVICPVKLSDKEYSVRLSVKEEKVIFCIYEYTFVFKIEDLNYGRVGLFRNEGFKDIYINKLSFSGEKKEKDIEIVNNKKYIIPLDNGGTFPYEITLNVINVGGDLYKVESKLDGGYNLNRRYKAYGNVWAFAYEDIKEPYIKVCNSERLYLSKDTIRICDNYYTNVPLIEDTTKVYKSFYNVVNLPIENTFYFRIKDISNFTFTYGYKHYNSFGQELYSGEREFVYNKDGEIIYNGKSLDSDISVICKSKTSDYILNKISNDIVDKEKVYKHLEGNHYFTNKDEIEFDINLYSNKYDNLEIRYFYEDAFYKKITDEEIISLGLVDFLFAKTSNVKTKKIKLNIGVYHLNVSVFSHNRKILEHKSAFEVFDLEGKITPQQASGLPSTYCGDGGTANCYIAYPDYWNTQADCNFNHYFDIVLYRAMECEKRKTWQVLEIMQKKLFVWANNRCVDMDIINSEKYYEFEFIKHADYIFLNYPTAFTDNRFDFYVYGYYEKMYLGILQEFLDCDKEMCNLLGFDNVKYFTKEKFNRLLSLCSAKWIKFALEKLTLMYMEQWDKVKKINSKVKRHSYGPYPIYGTNSISAHSTKWFGIDIKEADKIFDGIYQFEDYPFCCSYPTHRSSFALNSILLLNDKLNFYPELYDSFLPGCPDGFTSAGRPPFGEYHNPYYTINSQVNDYIFGCPRYTKDGYKYWQGKSFMMFSVFSENPKNRLESYITNVKFINENTPKKPLKAVYFLYEISDKDDRVEMDYSPNAFHNISEAGLEYVNGIIRENGLNGVLTDSEGLIHLNLEEIEMLVIPSVTLLSKEVVLRIREISNHNIPIILVGHAGALEDIFGVKDESNKCWVTKLYNLDNSENITNINGEFINKPLSCETRLYADNNNSVIMVKNNNLVINVPTAQVGIDNFRRVGYLGRANASKLIRDTVEKFIKRNIKNQVIAPDKTGITLFENQKGETKMLVFDYNYHDSDDLLNSKNILLEFNMEIKDIVPENNVEIIKEYNGKNLLSISFDIRPYETLNFTLIK